MVDFSQVLQENIGDIERPVLAPPGTYRMMVTKHPDILERSEYQIIEFSLKAIEAQPDVDEDELKAFGDVTSILSRYAFLFPTGEDATENDTQRSLFRLKTFLEDHLQVDDAAKMSVNEALSASTNCQCLATILHKPDKNDTNIFHANIAKTAPTS